MAIAFRQINRVPSRVLDLRIALVLVLIDFAIGVVGFMWLEAYSFREALYMSVITISTVGFTEVQPLGPAGQIFVSIYIVVNFAVVAYVLAVFGYYVTQGELFKQWHLNSIKQQIDKLSGHVVLCGYGRYGLEIVQHLREQKLPFVIVEKSDTRIQKMQESEENILYVQGDATQEEVLTAAGLDRARSLICSFADDAECIFTVLTARQMEPKINIVSRVDNLKSEGKLKLAGANHVIRPEQVGGYYMATLTTKPGAIEFFGFLTSDKDNNINFEEISYQAIPERMRHCSLRELQLRSLTGVNVIGYRMANGRYRVNPGPDTVLRPGDSFIVLGNTNHLGKLRAILRQPKW